VKVGEQPDNFLGSGACGGLDYDNDGFSDVLVAAGGFDPARNAANAGKIYVWSGANQSLLFSTIGEAKSSGLGDGAGAPAGRVNADLFDDLAIGSRGFNNGFGKIYVYAGGSGALLYTKLGKSLGLTNTSGFGGYLASTPGDFNGDGRSDIAAAAPFHSGSNGRIYIWSGADASQLALLNGSVAGNLGDSMAFADVNDDGLGDLVVGEPGYAGGAGRVHVLLGPGATPAGYSPVVGQNGGFGSEVASLGDFDGDGIDDFAVGAPSYTASLSAQGKVYVYSGFDGSLLASHTGAAANQSVGLKVSAAGDFNHDGLADVAVRQVGSARGVLVLPGPDLGGGVSLAFYANPTVSYGSNFCGAGDTNGDLFDDLVVASPADSSGGLSAGKIYIESFYP
jgi:hypothetical protein